MKKSTLISTLAMVVIVALALTTATFAWYTANNQVTATSSATAGAASDSSLVISKTTTFSTGNTSATIDGKDGLMPMMPKSDWTAEDATVSTFDDAKADMNGAIRTNGSFDKLSKYVDKYFAGTFYVKNDAAAGGDDVSLSIELANGTVIVDGTETDGDVDALNMLRVAIFVTDKTGSETFIGVLRTAGTVSYVDVTADDATESGTAFSDATKIGSSFDNIATVAAQDYVTINFIAWFEGSSLTQDNSGAVATFNLVVDGE